MTSEAKQSLKQRVLAQRNEDIKQMNIYIACMRKVESEYEKYFAEIKKHSSDFTLTKSVTPYVKNVYFRQNVNQQPINVDTIEMSYNQCRISYVGKLPEKWANTIEIGVEEHKTSGRRSWNTTNHGFKLRLRMDWGKEVYYKSVKTFVNRITDFVSDKWVIHNNQILLDKKREMALTEARIKFSETNHIGIVNDNLIMVKYDNGTEIRLAHSVNLETGEVSFTIKSIIPPKNMDKETIINFINSLGSL